MKRVLIPLFVWAICAFASAQSDPTKPVLTVNGESVGGMEYFRRMEFLPGVGKLVGDRFVSSWPGYLAMQQLINERLLLQLAKEKGVYPKPADVTKAVNDRVTANPTMMANLEKVGISKADFERQVTIDLAEFNLITMGVNITDIEVEKFYKDNPSRFTMPRRYKLRMIAVTTEGKEAVDADLKAGKKFEDVAKTHSKAPSAKDGGAMGEYVPVTAFAEPTKVVLMRTKIGGVSDWIQGETGNWFKFFVIDAKAEEKVPLDAKLRGDIRTQMMVDRGRVRNNIDKMMMEMRRKAVVVVNQPAISDMIQEWLKTSTIE